MSDDDVSARGDMESSDRGADLIAQVPADERDITVPWLRHALRSASDLPELHGSASVHPERIGTDVGLMSLLYRVTWTGGRGGVIVKLWEPNDEATDAELRFYEELAAHVPVRISRCFHAALDHERNRAVLVLEDLADLEPGDCLAPVPPAHAPALARTLARLHGTFWQDRRLEQASWLPLVPGPRHERRWYEDRVRGFMARFEERLDPFSRHLLGRARQLDAVAAEVLEPEPWTLLHRDLHLDNVLFDAPGAPPVLLDWSLVARGPGAVDLAQLLYAIGTPGDREVLLEHYLDELEGHGIVRSPAEVERATVAGVMQLFVTWTCGVATWEPEAPRQRAILSDGIDRALSAVTHHAEAIEAALEGSDASGH